MWFDLVSDVLSPQEKQAVSLETDSLQVAKEKKRQFESSQPRGAESSLPTRTPIAEVLSAVSSDRT